MPFPADVVVLLRHRPSEPDRTTTLSGEKRRRCAPSAKPRHQTRSNRGGPQRDEQGPLRGRRSLVHDVHEHAHQPERYDERIGSLLLFASSFGRWWKADSLARDVPADLADLRHDFFAMLSFSL